MATFGSLSPATEAPRRREMQRKASTLSALSDDPCNSGRLSCYQRRNRRSRRHCRASRERKLVSALPPQILVDIEVLLNLSARYSQGFHKTFKECLENVNCGRLCIRYSQGFPRTFQECPENVNCGKLLSFGLQFRPFDPGENRIADLEPFSLIFDPSERFKYGLEIILGRPFTYLSFYSFVDRHLSPKRLDICKEWGMTRKIQVCLSGMFFWMSQRMGHDMCLTGHDCPKWPKRVFMAFYSENGAFSPF